MAALPIPRLRTLVIAGAAIAAIAIVALLTAFGPSAAPQRVPATATPPAQRPAVPQGATGPVAEQAGVPVGFARSESGAVAAAATYAAAPQRWLYFTDDEITAAVHEIATPVAAPRIAADVTADVQVARRHLGESTGAVWWLVRPLAWRIDDFTADEATVSVWTVTLLSAEAVAAPQAEWVTVGLDLAWVDGDWRVDAVRDTPGPTPMTGPADQPWVSSSFDAALTGFTRIDGEPLL